MGYQDYKMMDAGSRFGRYWPTIAMAIRIAFIGTVFGLLLESSRAEYLPWLASGWIVWGFLGGAFQGVSGAYVSSKNLMLSIPLDYRSFILRVVARDLLGFFQKLPLVLIVVIFYSVPVKIQILLSIPALLVTLVFLFGVGMALAPVLARFRDVGPFISSILGVMFFVLPIMWRPEDLNSEVAHFVVGLNPFYHYLQLVRLPLISEAPTVTNWILATVGAVTVFLVGTLVYKRTLTRIMYWA